MILQSFITYSMIIILLVIFSQKLLIFLGKIQHNYALNYFFWNFNPIVSIEKIYYTEQKQLMKVFKFCSGDNSAK